MLRYQPFTASAQMLAASLNRAPLRQGHWNPGIAILQGALVDVGYALPKSTKKRGHPDGIFGWETLGVVKAFQTSQGLNPDGVVGRKTLAALDVLMHTQAKPIVPSSPAIRPAPRTQHYELGTADPPLGPNPGSGTWNSRPATASYVALKAAILTYLVDAAIVIGANAAKHMAHYLGNSGSTCDLNLDAMIREVPSAKQALLAEIGQAQDFIEMLPVGKHNFTSRSAEGGYNGKDESWNWYFATGGYVSWGKGVAVVSQGAKGREYSMDFEYKVFDRYNWDKGKSVTIFKITITDEFMGEFHRQGLAREFDCVGSIKRRLSWQHGETISVEKFDRSAGARA